MSIVDRFMSKVEKTEGCWNWTGALTRGYGYFSLNGKAQRAHRVAYSLFVGPLAEDAVVRHTCDNPRCVNPAHLVVGSQADNMTDKVMRGRQSRLVGSTSGRAKLTEDIVKTIRLVHANGINGVEISRATGIPVGTIYAVVKRRSWRHV